jgi:N-acetylglucosaminyldiphosphoundecaprenol N-acetyl-beta-D-mannosaminyltransferase
VRLHAVTEQQTIDHILRGLGAGRGGVVMTPNLDHMRRCIKDLSFSAMLDEAELVIADGMPLVWASRLQGTPLPQRVAGSDLITSLSGAAALRGRSVFLLGGLPGTAQAAAAKLRGQFPALNVVGHHCPPLGFENDPVQMELIVSKLAAAQPDIVYVALGSPKQERLIAMLRLVVPGAWWLGVGMSFSFLAGDVRRAPGWMRNTGLEWVHRLGQEPRRLFKRYIVFGIPFGIKLLAESSLRGVTTGLRKPAPALQLSPSPCTQGEGWGEGSSAMPRVVASSQFSATPSVPTSIAKTTGTSALSLSRLRGLVLLSASASRTPLTAAAGRSSLDLPIARGETVLHQWLAQFRNLASELGLDPLPVRVLLSRNSMAPRSATSASHVSVERDLSDHRGDGALLAKLAGEYDDEDLLLVATTEQVVLGDLGPPIRSASRDGVMVNLISHEQSIPGGLILMSCAALRLIPTDRIVDINEQFLPQVAAKTEVRRLAVDAPAALPVRTVDEYMRAVACLRCGSRKLTDPLAETWASSFSLVEASAEVDKTARLHDSVILAGGRVDAGAVVVRSVVCSGGIVHKDGRAVDRIVVASE